ncbi:hypothetical protein L208DRAFT_1408399 [Tricholoma matsutake]|nr:hypothetical protein L208DRAFT_1408399 [Tricholoma matsutake 945]
MASRLARRLLFRPQLMDWQYRRHIDGHNYMWALPEMLEGAKEAVFILDWWLTPE